MQFKSESQSGHSGRSYQISKRFLSHWQRDKQQRH